MPKPCPSKSSRPEMGVRSKARSLPPSPTLPDPASVLSPQCPCTVTHYTQKSSSLPGRHLPVMGCPSTQVISFMRLSFSPTVLKQNPTPPHPCLPGVLSPPSREHSFSVAWFSSASCCGQPFLTPTLCIRLL